MNKDELKSKRASKIKDSGVVDLNSIPLTTLSEAILINDNLEKLTEAVKAIPVVELPEPMEIPEYPEFPSEMQISNLPEVQKVEITNLPDEKDDKETVKLLQEILAESKKKEQYAYDIEIDPTLKEELRGLDGEDGKDGIEIEPSEIVSKLESLKGNDRLGVEAIKGLDILINQINTKGKQFVGSNARLLSLLLDVNINSPTNGQGLVYNSASQKWENDTVSGGVSVSFESVSSNLSAYDATLNYNGSGDITSETPLSPSALASAVWNSLAADFNVSGTMGNKLNGAGSAGDPWTTDLDSYTTPGTAGALMKKASKPKISL